ncbi:Cthe_2314 family HEPN domain-containing protein [Paenibacillus harenae]|uniref:Cthe_2314 family HEPN domain-containing protein n=1 Tax=Paenibacillus harenae TaxID=306543 RepID=UPI00278DE6CF|nr:Cthe_2314 family HEPN domain-containing protein [Paenibacillus harenae]MDQ0060714.1 superfamily II RNA helicase [Paenibacillus harenae]
MLRFLFDEPSREATGCLAETLRLMEEFGTLVSKQIAAGQDPDHKLRKYEIWTLGLRSALDELEQSHYAAGKYKELIRAVSVHQMTPQERMNYSRYVYYDKNGFIRVFSLLDKLGTLLNDLLDMRTEKVKAHFSYFTVLRNMRERKAHPELTWKLNDVKEKYKEATNRLRKRRNTEIHYMNSEMHDDLIQSHRMYGEEAKLENLEQQAADLSDGVMLAMESMRLSFQYGCKLMRK